eukprot:5618711-Prymnesium_polylepis.1
MNADGTSLLRLNLKRPSNIPDGADPHVYLIKANKTGGPCITLGPFTAEQCDKQGKECDLVEVSPLDVNAKYSFSFCPSNSAREEKAAFSRAFSSQLETVKTQPALTLDGGGDGGDGGDGGNGGGGIGMLHGVASGGYDELGPPNMSGGDDGATGGAATDEGVPVATPALAKPIFHSKGRNEDGTAYIRLVVPKPG